MDVQRASTGAAVYGTGSKEVGLGAARLLPSVAPGLWRGWYIGRSARLESDVGMKVPCRFDSGPLLQFSGRVRTLASQRLSKRRTDESRLLVQLQSLPPFGENMFLCGDCHPKKCPVIVLHLQSQGPCEGCGKTRLTYDCHSHLPVESPKKKKKKVGDRAKR
jgi:hypothetical protein